MSVGIHHTDGGLKWLQLDCFGTILVRYLSIFPCIFEVCIQICQKSKKTTIIEYNILFTFGAVIIRVSEQL
jgi:hypothetical protein